VRSSTGRCEASQIGDIRKSSGVDARPGRVRIGPSLECQSRPGRRPGLGDQVERGIVEVQLGEVGAVDGEETAGDGRWKSTLGYHQDSGPVGRDPVDTSVLAWLGELPFIGAIGVGDVVRMVIIAGGPQEDDGALGVQDGIRDRGGRSSRRRRRTGAARGARCHGHRRFAARAARDERDQGDHHRQRVARCRAGPNRRHVSSLCPDGTAPRSHTRRRD
jgi:hypothetical protein